MNSLGESFKNAFKGLLNLITSEPNAKIHAAATITVIVLGIYYELNIIEWAFITYSIIMVWSAEALNTAIERLSDVVSPELNPGIKEVKDLASGAVLIVAIGAVIIGILVFGPYFIASF
jgi:diacylglycerol kinase